MRAAVDGDAASDLARTTGLDALTARLLISRGIIEPAEADRFLNPRLADLPDPYRMKDLERAARRLADAIVSGERVALYGDYDVDGVSSTSVLFLFLAGERLVARPYIPKRLTEGYGLNEGAVERLAAEGTKVLVTLDCGITAAREIARANALGIDCIVVDHHRCPPQLPEALATLNPQQSDCGYPDKGLAAAGVCFNLIVGLRKVLRERGWYTGREEPNLRRYLDLVSLGTIADMVPLSGVNRVLAWYGLEELRAARRPGVRALLDVSRVLASRCTGSDVGFRLGPRINAAGRLSDASSGVQLLVSADMATARPLADTLDAANAQRQQIEADVFRAAASMVEDMSATQGNLPEAIVLHDEAWHPGVVGIVASKMVEKYGRPAIIVGEGGRGSGRTARGLHLYDALAAVSGCLHKFGGHRAAAGLTVEAHRFEEFRGAFLEHLKSDPKLEPIGDTLVYDDDLAPSELTDEIATALARLQPFGNGNPQPLFRTSGVEVRSARVVGNDHLKLRVGQGPRGAGVDAIYFKGANLHEQMYPGRPLDLAYHFERSEFSGVEYLELRVRDLRAL